ncbi:type IV pilus assembly protein PilC [Mucilaginibacter yixingensis]|uniref:General secretion pathway protein F n=1 Tax=Mucilaginibacter yixingensis TaxID=1295612 RepID=A0A2T5J4J2_9SPHI|nr:type II secretion system F family protein [Mucilaginibacter yixingensis]PTQ92440.1 type IV pilus assembly protein PilC [Mucilaginibacter yixingensis]
MPTIDLNKYQPPKVARKPESSKNENGLLAFMNKDISFGSKELSDKKKEAFYLELSSLLKAGINLKDSLELVTSGQKQEKDIKLFEEVLAKVKKGSKFSEALQASGKFSLYEVFSIQIGEETGKQTEVLEDMARFFQNKIKQRRKVISALTYPCIVMLTSLGAVFFMLKFIVPMFGDIFKRFGGHLPWITEKIISVSNTLQNWAGPVFLAVIGLTTVLYVGRKNEQVRSVSSRILLRIPLAGELVQKIYLARFCNSMRLLINARLPLLKAITLVRQMIGFYPIEHSLKKVEDDILHGRQLHESFRQFKVYPAKMIQLIKVGEETSKLDYFFGIISEQYIEEVEFKTGTISSMMEPLIILFLGAVVGTILIAMYLPLFQMSNNFQ